MRRSVVGVAVLVVVLAVVPSVCLAGGLRAGGSAGEFDPLGPVPLATADDEVPLTAPGDLASPGFGRTRLKYIWPYRVKAISKSVSYWRVDYIQVKNYMANLDTGWVSSWYTNYRYDWYGWISAYHYEDSEYQWNYYSKGKHLFRDRGVSYTATTQVYGYM